MLILCRFTLLFAQVLLHTCNKIFQLHAGFHFRILQWLKETKQKGECDLRKD